MKTDARHLTRTAPGAVVEFRGVDTAEGKWGAGTWITQGRGQYDGSSDVVVPVVNPDGFSTKLRLNMFDPIEVTAERLPW